MIGNPKGTVIFDEAEAALTRLNTLSQTDLLANPENPDSYNITADILLRWTKLYVQTAANNTSNAVAVGRALLMIRALEKFFPGSLSK